MSKSNGKRMGRHCAGRVAVLAVLLLICLLSGSHAAAPGNREAGNDLEAQAKAAALRAATNAATMGFAPSLEMKENADFLLTPALLVQEALSDDVIVTYPSE